MCCRVVAAHDVAVVTHDGSAQYLPSELLREPFVFALFIGPLIPSLLLSLSGCRLNPCLFIAAVA